MLVRDKRRNLRSGAAAVETALVVIPLFMFFTGVFEYGRFLLDRQLLNNAAREACRWALANQSTSGYTNTTVQNQVYTLVNQYMAGRTADFASWSTSNVVCYGQQSGAHVADVTTLEPGDFITVSIGTPPSGSGATATALTYDFMKIFHVAYVPTTVPMNSACTMLCEGGV